MDRTAVSPLKPNDADFTEQGLRHFKPYPEYKDSVVDWLGKIPVHWEAKRLKRLFKVVNGSTPRSEEPSYWDGDIPWVTPDDLGELTSRELLEPRRYITEDGYRSCGTSMVPSGSLVLSTRAPIGHLAIAGVNLCTNQGCRSLVFRKDHNRYFFYYLLFAAHLELESWGQGSTFKELAKSKLEYISLVDLPLHEQLAIAEFLERETRRIDESLAKKGRLIELLEEKRTALISQAVTKGLEPNVPLKDSGVEWLGEIPSHWQVYKMKRIADIDYGIGLELDRTLTDGTPIISLPNISIDGNLVLKEVPFINLVEQEKDKLLLKRGDLLFNWRSGSSDHVGKTALFDVDGEYTHVSFLLRIRFRSDEFIPRYFQRYLNTLRFRGFFLTTKAGVNNTFNQSELRELEILVPPTAEQSAIAAFIDYEATEINMLIAKIGEGIDRLKEFRTALISAAVTGKIDVRDGVK